MIEFFFFNDTATTEIYTLSLHDALPICGERLHLGMRFARALVPALAHDDPVLHDHAADVGIGRRGVAAPSGDRKSTRLNSSHTVISYAVFCLKKKLNGLETLVIIMVPNK